MNRERQAGLAAAIRTLLADRTQTLADDVSRVSYRSYLSGDVAVRERETVFRRCPQLGCPSARLPSPGSYVLSSLNGRPVVIVRTAQGDVRAFLNLCRHRGAPLVTSPAGSLSAFVCPYHHWSFRLTDELISPVHAGCFSGLSEQERRLHGVPAAEKGGFIWLAEDEGAFSEAALPEETLGELESFNFSAYHHYGGFSLQKGG